LTQNFSEIVRDFYEVLDRGDLNRAMEFFHPDVVYERGGMPTIRGFDQLDNFFHSARPIEKSHHEINTLLSVNELVAVRGIVHATLKTGANVDVRFADFHEFKDKKIWRRYSFFMDKFA
jgi:ketosteroid isomerase-like protein